jgi:hypothetical protein
VTNKECCNLDVYLLVLGRLADPFCTILSAFLSQQRYMFSVCSNVYQVLSELETISGHQPVVLITRPAMLISQAELFLTQRFQNLRMIGWLDSNENLSGCAVAQTVGNGMAMVNCCDQVRNVIESFCKIFPQESPVSDTGKTEVAGKIGPLEYKLCDGEINALLGVE